MNKAAKHTRKNVRNIEIELDEMDEMTKLATQTAALLHCLCHTDKEDCDIKSLNDSLWILSDLAFGLKKLVMKTMDSADGTGKGEAI